MGCDVLLTEQKGAFPQKVNERHHYSEHDSFFTDKSNAL